MRTKDELLEAIKAHYSEQKQKFGKMVSVTKMLNTVKPFVNWNEVAQRCSDNPEHEFFGKSVEFILKDWRTRSKRGTQKGISLDKFIQTYLEKGKVVYPTLPDETDENFQHIKDTIKKCELWLNMYQTEIEPHVEFIGCEIWFASKFGYHGRVDYLARMKNSGMCIVIDWKNTEKIYYSSQFEGMRGAMEGFDNCEMVQYSLQTDFYRNVLEEIGERAATRIIQVTKEAVTTHKSIIPYDVEKIRNIAESTKY